MSEQAHERKEHYKRVRTEFDDLDTEDKVLFLMEATVSTIARGVDEFGRAVSDEINKAFSRRAEKKERREEDAAASETASTSTKSKSSKAGTSTKSKSAGSTSAGNGSEDKDEGAV